MSHERNSIRHLQICTFLKHFWLTEKGGGCFETTTTTTTTPVTFFLLLHYIIFDTRCFEEHACAIVHTLVVATTIAIIFVLQVSDLYKWLEETPTVGLRARQQSILWLESKAIEYNIEGRHFPNI
jgi:hypothetical protein